MINLVTGYRGKAHVTADEEAARNLMIFDDFYVATNGDQLAYNLVSNNQIRILSGDLLVQGRFVRVENYEDVTIETGTQETFRTDLICLRYEKDTATGVENMALVAIKGTESATAGEVPAYNEGLIAEGDNPVDFPLYRVELEGINVTTVTALFTPKGNMFGEYVTEEDLRTALDGIEEDLQTALSDKADSDHTHAASKITAGTFSATGIIAKSGTDYTTARVRNIKASTTDLTAGTSTLTSGDLYFVYE